VLTASPGASFPASLDARPARWDGDSEFVVEWIRDKPGADAERRLPLDSGRASNFTTLEPECAENSKGWRRLRYMNELGRSGRVGTSKIDRCSQAAGRVSSEDDYGGAEEARGGRRLERRSGFPRSLSLLFLCPLQLGRLLKGARAQAHGIQALRERTECVQSG
jgi:hypothetical protein